MTPTIPDEAPAEMARPPIDPRIRRRRIEVARHQGRRRLRLAVGGVASVVAVAGGWATTRSPLLDVDRVEVVGAAHTGPAVVETASGVRRGSAMTALDEAGAARRLEALPWVRRAQLRREWPGTVVITVAERTPVASLPGRNRRPALVDAAGRVLDEGAPPPGLPVLEGVPPAGPAGSALGAEAAGVLQVAAALPRTLRPWVASVVADGRGNVELRLKPSGVVRLGPPDRVGEKLRAVSTVLAGADVDDLAVLDVQSPANPLLTRGASAGKVSALSGG